MSPILLCTCHLFILPHCCLFVGCKCTSVAPIVVQMSWVWLTLAGTVVHQSENPVVVLTILVTEELLPLLSETYIMLEL